MRQNLTYPGGTRRGLVAGLAISLLLHIAVLVLMRAPTTPPAAPDARRWTQPLAVHLLPPPPPRASATPSVPVRKDPPRRERAIARTVAPPRRDATERTAITVVPSRPADTAPPPATAEGTPAFDPDAARAAARAMANDLHPPATNWAAEKLNQGKEWKETKDQRLGRAVANSARPDCKTAYAGAGLLAPLLMLADKKDSGCKF